MSAAVMFFYENAAHAHDPKTQTEVNGRLHGAINLADAEAWARRSGCYYVWEEDYEPAEYQEEDGSWHDAPAVCCVMYQHAPDPSDEPVLLGSLSGIIESADALEQRNHRRVVQAEIALEAMPS